MECKTRAHSHNRMNNMHARIWGRMPHLTGRSCVVEVYAEKRFSVSFRGAAFIAWARANAYL